MHQCCHLHQGQDLHGKLKCLLDCPPLMGLVWFQLDMMSEQHVLTFQVFLTHLPQSTQDWAGAH